MDPSQKENAFVFIFIIFIFVTAKWASVGMGSVSRNSGQSRSVDHRGELVPLGIGSEGGQRQTRHLSILGIASFEGNPISAEEFAEELSTGGKRCCQRTEF